MSIIDKVRSHLQTLKTVEEKLDYFKKIKYENIEGELDKLGLGLGFQKGGPAYETSRRGKRLEILESLYPGIDNFVTGLEIPESIYDEHFSINLSDYHYSYWFLKYNAEAFYRGALFSRYEIYDILKSPNKISRINDLLKKLDEDLSNLPISDQREYERAKADYYNPIYYDDPETNPKDKPRDLLKNAHSGDNPAVRSYAEYHFLRPFLVNHLNEEGHSFNIDDNKQSTDSHLHHDLLKQNNKFIKGMPLNEVYEHFSVLTKLPPDREPFLSNEQLTAFIKRGFLLDKSQKKQKVSCPLGSKGDFLSEFAHFFNKAGTDYEIPSLPNRIKWVADCFNNWNEEEIKHSFRMKNPKKAKR